MKIDNQYALKSGLILLVFAFIFIALVQIVWLKTQTRIKNSIAEIRLERLNELVYDYDNNILDEAITKTATLYGVSQTLWIYFAKKNNRTYAYLIEHTYPQGYGGDMVLLSAITADGRLIGTRVLYHKETPGLGDGIEAYKSNWILQFSKQSQKTTATAPLKWQLTREGGEFDALTGATISSRAVLSALSELLNYWHKQPIQ